MRGSQRRAARLLAPVHSVSARPGGRTAVEFAVRLLELAVDYSQAFGEHPNMSTCRLIVPGATVAGGLLGTANISGAATRANASAFRIRRCSSHGCALSGVGPSSHKSRNHSAPKVLFKFEHGGKITPQLFAELVAEPIALGVEIVGRARPFSQFDDQRLSKSKLAEGAHIGAQRIGEPLGVTVFVLGTRRRETITEAIELLGIDGIDVETTRERRLDDGAMRHFDCPVDGTCLSAGYTREPRGHLGQARVHGQNPLTEALSAPIGDADAVILGRPVDAGEPAFQFVHPMLPHSISNRRDLSLPCIGAPGGLPTGPQFAATRRGTGPPQVLTKKIGRTGGSSLLPASRLGPLGLPTPGSDRMGKGTGGQDRRPLCDGSRDRPAEKIRPNGRATDSRPKSTKLAQPHRIDHEESLDLPDRYCLHWWIAFVRQPRALALAQARLGQVWDPSGNTSP
jgi:hypothetical protein